MLSFIYFQCHTFQAVLLARNFSRGANSVVLYSRKDKNHRRSWNNVLSSFASWSCKIYRSYYVRQEMLWLGVLVGWLVRSLVPYACCDFLKSKSLILIKFGVDVQHLCQVSQCFEGQGESSRSQPPYWESSTRPWFTISSPNLEIIISAWNMTSDIIQDLSEEVWSLPSGF